jgi:hypothetical protein
VLSPRKGFCCAYRSHTGNASCSALGYRAVRRYGVWRGQMVLNGRFEKCGTTYRRHHPVTLRGQAGYCEVGDCGISDLACVNPCLNGCMNCNWTWQSREIRQQEKQKNARPPRENKQYHDPD